MIQRLYLVLSMLVLLGFDLTPVQGQSPADCEDFLFDLSDVRFYEIAAPTGYEAAWEVHIRQPLDHQNPSEGAFWQRLFVSHVDRGRPTVLVTEGYDRGRNYPSELATAIGANQVIVEHRYYGASVPDSIDYRYLNIKQAAADLHRIRTVLGDYFNGPWVASGISKGGQTTIFYRYFYPDDVAASVPYVAPVNLSLEDGRIYDFLNEVGTRSCRNCIEAIQKRILQDYEESLLRLRWHAKGEGLRFNYLTVEEAFEYAVLEYPFSFWQWGSDCEDIPKANAELDVILDHFLDVSGLGFFSDSGMEDYASHYYQCAVEYGYYGYESAPFKELLRALPTDSNPSAIFTPNHMDVPYDGGILAKTVYDWIQANGDEFIYINGALDTWSATAMQENPERDALYFFLEGESHGTARLRNMTAEQRSEVKAALERWLEVPVTGDLSE